MPRSGEGDAVAHRIASTRPFQRRRSCWARGRGSSRTPWMLGRRRRTGDGLFTIASALKRVLWPACRCRRNRPLKSPQRIRFHLGADSVVYGGRTHLVILARSPMHNVRLPFPRCCVRYSHESGRRSCPKFENSREQKRLGRRAQQASIRCSRNPVPAPSLLPISLAKSQSPVRVQRAMGAPICSVTTYVLTERVRGLRPRRLGLAKP